MRQQHSKIIFIQWLLYACFIFTSIMSALSFAAVMPLPPDQAFKLQVTANGSQTALVNFKIAPGYYLYSQRVRITSPTDAAAQIHYPAALAKLTDRGHAEGIYTGNVAITIVPSLPAAQETLLIEYQGCSQRGFCYPPMQHKFLWDVQNTTVTQVIAASQLMPHPARVAFSSLLTDQNGVSNMLASQQFGMVLVIFAALGLLLAFTPCVLPMVPILTSIIVGQKESVNAKKAFLLSSTYVLGSALTYSLAGVAIACMGSSLQIYLEKPWIIAIVSSIFVLLALSLFGLYDLRLPNKLQSSITALSRKQKSGTYVGVFIMGIVSSLIVSPCVTAPLVGVLMYIAQTGNVWLGATALFMLGLGMGMPLIVIGTSAGKWMPRRGRWMLVVQKIFGVLMLGMAIWLLARVYSSLTIEVFSGVILLAGAVYISWYLPTQGKVFKFQHSAGVLLGFLGVLIVACSIGMPTLFKTKAAATHSFIIVRNVDDLTKQISIAQQAHKPVILDFYADWCESCVVMDKNVFASKDVQHVLNNFVLLRADLSANNAADELMLKNFAIVAPPTVLFFNNAGQEVNSKRIIGAVDAQDFMRRINTFMTASCDKKVQC